MLLHRTLIVTAALALAAPAWSAQPGRGLGAPLPPRQIVVDNKLPAKALPGDVKTLIAARKALALLDKTPLPVGKHRLAGFP
jgi:hypothetical protein